jgi:hypothetical protein
MLKLSKTEIDVLQNAAPEIESLFGEMEIKRDEFVAEMDDLKRQISEAAKSAWEILDDAASAAEEYYDEKSEKWQDGDRGQAYDEWKNNLRLIADAIAEDVEAPEVTLPDMPDWVGEIRECDFAAFEYEG